MKKMKIPNSLGHFVQICHEICTTIYPLFGKQINRWFINFVVSNINYYIFITITHYYLHISDKIDYNLFYHVMFDKNIHWKFWPTRIIGPLDSGMVIKYSLIFCLNLPFSIFFF